MSSGWDALCWLRAALVIQNCTKINQFPSKCHAIRRDSSVDLTLLSSFFPRASKITVLWTETFFSQHPSIQKESQYIKYLCCDDKDMLCLWVNSIRIAKVRVHTLTQLTLMWPDLTVAEAALVNIKKITFYKCQIMKQVCVSFACPVWVNPV